ADGGSRTGGLGGAEDSCEWARRRGGERVKDVKPRRWGAFGAASGVEQVVSHCEDRRRRAARCPDLVVDVLYVVTDGLCRDAEEGGHAVVRVSLTAGQFDLAAVLEARCAALTDP